MITYECTKKELNELESFKLPRNISHIESKFKTLTINNKKYIIKIYINKLNTSGMNAIENNIITLITNGKIFEKILPELILPKHLIYVDKNYIAHTMEPINGINLSKIISSKNYTTEFKIKLLIEVGKLIEKFGELPGFDRKIYLGDVHEDNFILDENGKLKICDSPSCHIIGNGVTYSKYLSQNRNLNDPKLLPKYDKNIYDIIIPNKDTDILCYTFMILNLMAKKELQFLNLEEFTNYIDYLYSLKINKDFLDNIMDLFTLKPNTSPLLYLNTLTKEQFENSNFSIYKKRTNKFF